MRITQTAFLGLGSLTAISALHPNITASVPLASVTQAVLSGLPACATSCIKDTLASSTACALSDIECICTNDDFICPTYNCEKTACTPAENEQRQNNTLVLCADFGGINRNNCSAYGTSTNASTNASTSATPTPSSAPFTGDGGKIRGNEWLAGTTLLLGGVALLLAAL